MIKTSESVMRGHPDKVCDQIADSLLEAISLIDKNARCAIECLIKDNLLVIAGEVSTNAQVDYENIAKQTLNNIGYNGDEFDIMLQVSKQSSDIALGVDKGGAGDQGIMYGYACDETKEMMPLSIVLSRKLAMKLDSLTRLYPEIYGVDGKCQVSVEYDKNDKPTNVSCVVVSIQTKESVERNKYEGPIRMAIETVIPSKYLNESTKVLINPTGEFVKGGPYADSGLTGRKLQCDSYGGLALHGGGAWSGKDLSKVDRSAAYYARYIAKNIVKTFLVKYCEIGIAYAIGVADPVSISIKTDRTQSEDATLLEVIKKVFDLKPKTIKYAFMTFEKFGSLAEYGHVGISNQHPWEHTDREEELLEAMDQVLEDGEE
ncbi:MAG: methionine adenosyltransferase [Erysipelotrichales bacterium]|nr:methionine adenosyltransferase [Erysipelotrichales bacterium]